MKTTAVRALSMFRHSTLASHASGTTPGGKTTRPKNRGSAKKNGKKRWDLNPANDPAGGDSEASGGTLDTKRKTVYYSNRMHSKQPAEKHWDKKAQKHYWHG